MRSFVLGVALVVGGCGDKYAGVAAAEPLRASIEMASNDLDYEAARFSRSFELGAIEDLVLRITLDGTIEIGKTLLLEIYAPGGGRFQVYRRPIEGPLMQMVIPVAGTEFTKRQLDGEFTLVAALEGQSTPIGSTTVELTVQP